MSTTDITTTTELILKGQIAKIPIALRGALEDGKLGDLSGSVALRKSLPSFLADLESRDEFRKACDILKQLTGESNMTLDSLAFGYNFCSKVAKIVLTLTAGNSSCRFVILKMLGQDGFVAGLDLRLDRALFDNNPLSGLVGDISVEDVGIYYASKAFKDVKYDPGEVFQDVNTLTPKISEIMMEGRDFTEGINWSAKVLVGDVSLLDWPGIEEPPDSEDTKQAEETLLPKGSTTWINMDKSMGPLLLRRIGLSYDAPRVRLKFDAGLQLSCLTLTLEGLGLSYPLDQLTTDPTTIWQNLQFHLDGAAVAFERGPLTISGKLLKVKDHPLQLDGSLLVQTEGLIISAIGSYADINGTPSFFAFAAFHKELGGPAFFFVIGLAFGCGVNRALKLPTINEVHNFPLIKAAMEPDYLGKDSDLRRVRQKLNDHISPSPGNFWLAAGVRFTCFEMIQSFALLTVTFGTKFELALLGLSTLIVPTGAENPIGFAELALKANFSPDSGLLAIAAKLTPRSYILSKACHLTGGFAFYSWFKDNPDNDPNGYRAGDFVVTLGGYHPHFNKPAHYPTVPRLGFNWQIGDHLSMKGGVYFALTPSAVMAGASLDATWHSGDLKAWFNAYADFLLSWKPFHYEASMGLSIGVSYRLNLLFTHMTISVHIGVDLDLWGPPFAGKARVDLHVVSFTIHFGDSSPSVDPISWSEFKASFLPKLDADQAADAISTDTYCYTRVSGGLVKDLGKDKESSLDWIINPERFELVTHSVIPCTQATLITGNGSISSPATKSTTLAEKFLSKNPEFGVGPVDVANGDLVSHHIITVNKMEEDKPDYEYDFSAHITESISPVIGHIPRAAWSKDMALNPSINKVNSAPSTIENVVVGFTLRSKVEMPSHTLPIDVSTLQETRDETEPSEPFNWAVPEIPTTDDFHQTDTTSQLMSSINSDAVRTTRAEILNILADQGLNIDTEIDVKQLADSADEVLLDGPVLSYLGEERSS